MKTTEAGRKAEAAARTYLEMRGYHILEQNWRRPRCEVDIIALREGRLHFVEVKYRRGSEQGTGLDAITLTKIKQMRRGAWSYVDEVKWQGEYQLDAIEISGPEFSVLSFVEEVI